MHGEHYWARIRGMNSNTLLFMGFGIKMIYLILQKNVKFEKVIFGMKMVLQKQGGKSGFKIFSK